MSPGEKEAWAAGLALLVEEAKQGGRMTSDAIREHLRGSGTPAEAASVFRDEALLVKSRLREEAEKMGPLANREASEVKRTMAAALGSPFDEDLLEEAMAAVVILAEAVRGAGLKVGEEAIAEALRERPGVLVRTVMNA